MSASARAAGAPAWAVPAFESLGLYYSRAIAPGPCLVRYRIAQTTAWREGYPLVYDLRERQYRGSLVGLKPDTLYDIRLEADGQPVSFQARSRSEQFPIRKTTSLPGGNTDQTLYVVLEAGFVILRGLELKNAGLHGVLIRAAVEHVVVEDCHITGWGRSGGARVWGVFTGSDSGVYAENDAGHLVIQRNLIEYSRGGANDWESGHPSGPQARFGRILRGLAPI